MEALVAHAEQHVEEVPADEDFKPAKEDEDTNVEQEGPQGKSSQYRGVCYVKKSDKWTASISVGNKRVQLGYFAQEEDAALAYDAAATEHHPHPILNFVDGALNPDRFLNKDANQRHSTFTGVTFLAARRQWLAQIYLHTPEGRKKKHLGLFPDELLAALAYDQVAWEYYDHPVTNFLPDGTLNPNRFMGQKKTAGFARVTPGPHPSLTPMIKYDRVSRSLPEDEEDEDEGEEGDDDGDGDVEVPREGGRHRRGPPAAAGAAAEGVKEEGEQEAGGRRRSGRKRKAKTFSDAASEDELPDDDSPPPSDNSDDEGRGRSRRKGGRKVR